MQPFLFLFSIYPPLLFFFFSPLIYNVQISLKRVFLNIGNGPPWCQVYVPRHGRTPEPRFNNAPGARTKRFF